MDACIVVDLRHYSFMIFFLFPDGQALFFEVVVDMSHIGCTISTIFIFLRCHTQVSVLVGGNDIARITLAGNLAYCLQSLFSQLVTPINFHAQNVMIEPERRSDRRRKLELPVTFCCLGKQGFEQRCYSGQISDVGDGGMRILVKSGDNQSAGDKLVVFVPLQKCTDPGNCVRMVEITGEVVWLDRASCSFGLRYL